MQSGDGGWAAFDVDNDWALLNEVPFADHNAMLDPTCPDITGRVLESLCRRGLSGHEAVRRGVAYLLGAQEKDGSWYGRWGVNYIYGSFLAMRGLAASGAPEAKDAIAKAAQWLRTIQSPDGGWGESCASYDRECFVPAPSCPSQTAWPFWVCWPPATARASPSVVASNSFSIARGRRHMARGSHHRHRLPQCVLPHLRHVRDYFPLLALAQA